MCPVAFSAARGIEHFLAVSNTMDAGIVFFLNTIVAHATGHPFQVLFVGEFFDICIGMTIDAFQLSMDGSFYNIVFYEERNFSSTPFLKDFPVCQQAWISLSPNGTVELAKRSQMKVHLSLRFLLLAYRVIDHEENRPYMLFVRQD